jgi:tetratricopeptide (TPR) repeat protein
MRASTTIVVLLASALAVLAPATARAGSSSVAERTAFYADVRAQRREAAVAVGAAYHAQHPHDDRFALDYAYALLAAHRTAAAEALLARLQHSPIAAVRTAARRQLLAQAPKPTSAGAASPAVTSPAPSPFTNAYELLAGGDLRAARDAFQTALVTHPNDAAAWHQLSYIDYVLKDTPGMIDALDHDIALDPGDDHAKLERAYALLAAGRRSEAQTQLAILTRSRNAEVAVAAQRQLTASMAGAGKPERLGVFGYAENESRFHDTFFGIDGRYALATTRIEPYLAFHFSDDAKSSSLPATTILNDNVVILAVGLRTKVAPSTYAFVEGGEAQSLLTGHIQTDLRYGLQFSTRLGAGGRKSQTQIDASAAFYSRYLDTIAYANIAHDFFIGSKVVRGVVGVNAALDTSREFYNNAVEGFGGLQVRRGILTFRLVAVAGEYLGRGIDPPERTYTSIRPLLLVGYSH